MQLSAPENSLIQIDKLIIRLLCEAVSSYGP